MATSYSPGPPPTPSHGTPVVAHEKKRIQPHIERTTLIKLIGLAVLTVVVIALVVWAFAVN